MEERRGVLLGVGRWVQTEGGKRGDGERAREGDLSGSEGENDSVTARKRTNEATATRQKGTVTPETGDFNGRDSKRAE